MSAVQWVVRGQKVWTTWAHRSDYAVLLARTDPDVPKRRGITYFLLDVHQPGVDVRPLRHLTGEIDFNEVFLDGARVPDDQRVGDGSGVDHTVTLSRRVGRATDPVARQQLAGLYAEERIRAWTNERARGGRVAGRPPGPESSVGKVHSGELNQRIQVLATDLLGPDATAWGGPADPYADSLPREVHGMLRSRANTIEGGTSEVNRNIVGERVLGLPREADPWRDAPWRDVPRS